VEAIAVGVCGTDVEIVEGKYGWAPEGATAWCWAMNPWPLIDPVFSSAFKKATWWWESSAVPIRSLSCLRGG